jgi:AraC-like DNA-binding protein
MTVRIKGGSLNGGAAAAKVVTGAAKLGYRDVRGLSSVLAGTYAYEIGDEVITGWHHHDLHQLEYAVAGVAQVETATARYLLPPQQAVWIPAGVEHCTTLTRVRTLSVFFDPASSAKSGDRVRIVAVEPVLREMIRYAERWPIGRSTSDSVADGFFDTLASLIAESLDNEVPLRLPTSRDPLIAAATEYTLRHLDAVNIAAVCAAIGTSERTFRRTFAAEMGMPWRQYVLESRLMKAMALLAQPGRSVLGIATDVGFASASGFARAFHRYAGQTPSDYRRDALGAR